jgi:hypothetical protein
MEIGFFVRSDHLLSLFSKGLWLQISTGKGDANQRRNVDDKKCQKNWTKEPTCGKI